MLRMRQSQKGDKGGLRRKNKCNHKIAKEKEQEGHNSNSVGGSSSDHDHRDDQDRNDSEGLQPAKGVGPLYLTAILPQSTVKSGTFSGTAPTSNST
jgi:hypothetical protein